MSVTEEKFYKEIVDNYTDVVNERLGTTITAVSNEFFAPASNLIKPGPPIQDLQKFIPSGKWYDGWETRRHNPEPFDYVDFKLPLSCQLIGAEIDTAFFNGNHAPSISIEASSNGDSWDEIIPETPCGPTQRQFFIASSGLSSDAYSLVRLKMYPDGGIARFRLYGKVVPDLKSLSSLSHSIDTASVLNGGIAVSCSDQHFSRASNLLLPGSGIDMSDGWETARSRTPGHFDWVIIKLGAPTLIKKIVIDTSFFRGNFPQKMNVKAIDSRNLKYLSVSSPWFEIVPDSKTQADKLHEYPVLGDAIYDHVLVSMIPDGGIKRVRVFGDLDN